MPSSIQFLISNKNVSQINTCNGFYCDYFSPNKAYKPKMWTEAWTGWYWCLVSYFLVSMRIRNIQARDIA